MVHWGGHEQRLAARGSRLGSARCRRGVGRAGITLIVALATLPVVSTPVAAQSAIGFQGGVAVDPEQVFGGVFWQSDDLYGGLRLRPGIDGARGDGWRIATVNLDLVYGLPLGTSGWTLITGGGPSIVITRVPEFDFEDTGVGAHYMFGFGHDSGFFTEIRLGSGKAQQLKLGVGWAVTLN